MGSVTLLLISRGGAKKGSTLYHMIYERPLMLTGLKQRVDCRMLMQVHAALFPTVKLLAMSE